ncbi:hypothetical protein ACFFGR_02695 [Arthrobacter liuii]|uniref:8-oxoguanine DNA glycosylase OGG fold protein n=1 Tax=Arthrobacter liuii TaxID=1476996 RepID=UPI0035E81642
MECRGPAVEGPFEWKKKSWAKYLGDYSVLESLPNRIGRAGVLDSFKLIRDPNSALDAYIASYVWGYAGTGFGPYRAERVIRVTRTRQTASTSTPSCSRSRRSL